MKKHLFFIAILLFLMSSPARVSLAADEPVEQSEEEEEYGDGGVVAKSITSIRVLYEKVDLQTTYCSRLLPDGSRFLVAEEEWLKKNMISVSYVDKFMDLAEWKDRMRPVIRSSILTEMQKEAKETGERQYCENFYTAIQSGAYDYENSSMADDINQYSYFLNQVSKEETAFRQLKVLYGLGGAVDFCHKNVVKDRSFLQQYNRFKRNNKEIIDKAKQKISNIDLLEFVKLSMVNNVQRFFSSFKEKDIGCMLLMQRFENGFFDLASVVDKDKYREILFILNGQAVK